MLLNLNFTLLCVDSQSNARGRHAAIIGWDSMKIAQANISLKQMFAVHAPRPPRSTVMLVAEHV